MYPHPDLEAIEVTVEALFHISDHVNEPRPPSCDLGHQVMEETTTNLISDPEPNYPDLVPRFEPPGGEKILLINSINDEGTIVETMFLLVVLFGTCFLLYIFPPGP